ncbi:MULTISPECIES: hypothetical protein [Vibrio]|uniref:hypothetical protein n=1 Tax=Vibrio TaxID=662 RepID=UPI0004DF35F0|nr:hypothetical protein [Vibrio parahaemolyticus]EHD1698844.1 hypothetical protein [Vibrio vulnificus]EKZ9225794.1 hypothetical protein [Vibrio vulnificus]ELC9582633.1 hypothetical protein [Vibrio vulnificus]MCU8150203.1 hypothetical protein [Vibrio vulnificus]MCU8385883.1 hypothetical protein [Vibrio vulnificus]
MTSRAKKWLDREYVDSLKTMATMYASSSNINECFRNDSATIFSLLMRADAWGLHPDNVIQGSFYDQYGQIAYTGKLIKLILSNHPDISSVKVEEIGCWNKIHKKYRVASHPMNQEPVYEQTWDLALEPELSLTITVEFSSSEINPIEYSLSLADIDPSIKNLNPNWIVSPRAQLESLMFRDLAHSRLFQYVNSIDIRDSDSEQKESNASSTLNPMTTMSLPMSSALSQANCPIKKAEHLQQQMLKDLAASRYESIHERMNEMVDLVSQYGKELDDNSLYKLKAIYQECKSIILALASAQS